MLQAGEDPVSDLFDASHDLTPHCGGVDEPVDEAVELEHFGGDAELA